MWKFVLITKTACELAGMQTLQPFSGSSPPNSVVNWNTETHSLPIGYNDRCLVLKDRFLE